MIQHMHTICDRINVDVIVVNDGSNDAGKQSLTQSPNFARECAYINCPPYTAY